MLNVSAFKYWIQGAAYVALCFMSASAFAHSTVKACNIESQIETLAACNAGEGGGCIIVYQANSYCGGGTKYTAWTPGHNHVYNSIINAPYHNPASWAPENRDENDCFVSAGQTFCEGDANWIDSDGYSENGCNLQGLCPDDPDWRDADGYDINGFDDNGLDRGGNTAAEGGGYGGSAGSGGTPPDYYAAPEPVDPQNGNNYDGNGILQCTAAYPVTVTKSLLPGPVLDGLVGCSNDCQYRPFTTYLDFDYNQEVVQLNPTGLACNGTEPLLASIDIATYTAPPVGSEPDSQFDNLNSCYINGAYLYCDSPLDPDPPECYAHVNGWAGQQITCEEAGITPDPTTCGVFNGVYQCVSEQTNCASFNGTIQCINPNGDPIAQDDPDHPINGGNGDGNSNNDVFADSQDVIDNGQTVQQQTSQVLNAREIAREIDQALANDFSNIANAISNFDIDLNEDAEIPDGQTVVDDIETQVHDAVMAVGTDPDMSYPTDIFADLTSPITGMFPAPSDCSIFTFDILPAYEMAVNVDTCQLTLLRSIAEWFIYGLTFWTIIGIALRPHTEST